MDKIFITNIPMMGDKLEPKVYKSVKDYGIDTNMETRFPIIPVIKAKAIDDDEVKVITVRYKNSDSDRNLEMFKEELSSLDFKKMTIIDVDMPENQDDVTGIQMFLDTLNNIDNHVDVYACVTYGTKVMSMMMMHLLDSLAYLKDNVKVQGVYYGEVRRKNSEEIEGENYFYDISNLVFLNHAIKNISDLKVSNPEEFLMRLIKE